MQPTLFCAYLRHVTASVGASGRVWVGGSAETGGARAHCTTPGTEPPFCLLPARCTHVKSSREQSPRAPRVTRTPYLSPLLPSRLAFAARPLHKSDCYCMKQPGEQNIYDAGVDAARAPFVDPLT